MSLIDNTYFINDIDISGNIKRLIPIVPKSITFIRWQIPTGSGVGSLAPAGETLDSAKANLIDRDRTTSANIFTQGLFTALWVEYKVEFPSDIVFDGFDEIYMPFDIDVDTDLRDPSNATISWQLTSLGPYGIVRYSSFTDEQHPETIDIFGSRIVINYLPNEYYDGGGNANGEATYWSSLVSTADINSLFKVFGGGWAPS